MSNENILSYAGFTIGPIYDVMRHSKKTRELWFGSYFFSWYMETLISKLIGDDVTFLTPHINLDSGALIPNASFGGKYHDRFVLYSKHLLPEKLCSRIKNANEETISYFSEMIYGLAKQKSSFSRNVVLAEIDKILKGYLQPRFVAIEKGDIGLKNAVETIDEYLNTMEENVIFTLGISKNTCTRCKTLPGIAKITENEEDGQIIHHLCPICFIKLRGNHLPDLKKRLKEKLIEQRDGTRLPSYPTIQEIAAKEIFENTLVKSKLIRDEEGDIPFDQIEQIVKSHEVYGVTLKTVHKYFAVVQADGDNLGNLAKSVDNPAVLSKQLFEFSEKAESKITEYGGVPVYLGGDDILAFIPVLYKNKTVMDFIEDISNIYKDTVDQNQKKTTISFGVNIAYYKYPLASAHDQAASLLFGDAKTVKNCAALCLTRHSGAQIRLKLKIRDCEFQLFKILLDDVLNEVIKIPQGIHHNLVRFKTVIAHLQNAEQVKAFFENNFDEKDHQKFEPGLSQVEKLLSYYLFAGIHREKENAVDSVLSLLNFIKFLKGEEE